MGLLQGFSNADNEVRQEAERHFQETWMTRPDQLFPALIQTLGNADVPMVCGVCFCHSLNALSRK